ncbi:hypothetical protein N9K12_00060 [Methylophilaceae bacterium]|jgi:hypothetical protein|uniref:Uncharacterized protein n=1 Tax=Methylophilales bacterium HTCC2181 TaxID=383631 RepID=A0P5A9_9PROT|nr:hypothetical protein MB2181_01560 [Methylophilales bacterium HTCC2181]MBT3512880.1 hypothetical protein [Nitrosomonadales bacterium]MCH9781543.1 hypothetical protein [Betaproteobacteria bacterium]MDA9085201.1 hypothetical protein [Methylophilaceae bacterium]MBT5411134.1 hypothetical protein [Nitrosomonadales bacterium]|tara:strand:- start:2850 stop:3467 length:618 start_codon:yes stop_codon:yes gene_type:complete
MVKDHTKNIRLSIANKAAEIIMEEGITDYQYAKKKAVRYLDLDTVDLLPSNDEIDKALLDYRLIFKAELDIELVKTIKTEALRIMKFFESFNPYFVTQLSEGLLPKYPIIQINLFSDNMKEVEYILLNNNIPFETKDFNISEKRTKKQSLKKIPLILIERGNVPVELKIFEPHDQKRNKKNLMDMRGLDLKQLSNFDPNSLLSNS